MASTQLSTNITIRVSGKLRTQFHKKAERHGTPSEVLREIVLAFVEDRLVIQPPAKPKESLYHVP